MNLPLIRRFARGEALATPYLSHMKQQLAYSLVLINNNYFVRSGSQRAVASDLNTKLTGLLRTTGITPGKEQMLFGIVQRNC
jgi:hypothetical protein